MLWLDLEAKKVHSQCNNYTYNMSLMDIIATVGQKLAIEYHLVDTLYNASIYPATQIPLTLSENARLQLALSYNVLYSVTITATLCGQNSVNYTALNFSYGE